MNYAILTLVYFIGMSTMFYQSMAMDSLTMRLHGHLGKFNSFTGYLILSAIWPLAMWIQMYLRWLQVCDEAEDDRSAWMFCGRCNVKWRPTAYGPPAPDDYYCPECKRNGGVRLIQDIRQVIQERHS